MHRRVNSHRNFIGVLGRDFLVDIEKISVTLADRLFAQPRDGVGKIEIDSTTAGSDTTTFITNFLGCARCDIARRQISEAGVFSLQVIIAIRLRDFIWRLGAIFHPFGDPDAAIVAERLRHQRELRLMLAGDWDAGRVNLGETGIAEEGATFICAIGGGDIAATRISRKKKDVAITAGCENNGIAGNRANRARAEVPRNNPFGVAVDEHQIEHFGLWKHRDSPGRYLPAESLVGAKQQLLASLPARVKGARDLGATE